MFLASSGAASYQETVRTLLSKVMRRMGGIFHSYNERPGRILNMDASIFIWEDLQAANCFSLLLRLTVRASLNMNILVEFSAGVVPRRTGGNPSGSRKYKIKDIASIVLLFFTG